MYYLSPQAIQFKFSRLMKVGFILLLIGYSVSLVPTFAMSMFIAGLYIGSYLFYYFFYFLAIFGGTILTLIGSGLTLTGFILILIALFKLREFYGKEFLRKSRGAAILLIVTLSLNSFINILNLIIGGLYSFLYTFLYSFYGYGLGGVASVLNVIVTGLFTASFIVLGLSLKEMRIATQNKGRGLITSYIYPSVIIFQIIHIISAFFGDFLFVFFIFIIGAIAETVILIILSSEGLTAMSKVIRTVKSTTVLPQYHTDPTLSPQTTLPPTNKSVNFCIKCGSKIIEGAHFCGVCGHIIE